MIDTSVDIRKRKWDHKSNMTLTQTGETSSSDHTEYVRQGRESASVPPMPDAVKRSMELAFGKPIEEINAMALGKEAAAGMIQLDSERQPSLREDLSRLVSVLRENTQRIVDQAKKAGNHLLSDDRGEVKPIIPIVGGLALVILAGMWAIGQHNNVDNQQAQRAAEATASAQATQDQKNAIDTAATTYSPDEQRIGTFTIDKEHPNVTVGVDNYLKDHPGIKIDPADVNLGQFNTIQESGKVVGTVYAGDQIQFGKENVDGHEVIIAEKALPPAEPLSGDTIPSPTTH